MRRTFEEKSSLSVLARNKMLFDENTRRMPRTEKCEAFMDDILKAEEFGRSDVNRMAVIEGTGPWAYFKEFHHQMRLSYPKTSKVFIIVPVLWIITLVRFMRNNKKLRNTTAREIFKNAGVRSRMARDLEIFSR